MSQDPRKCRTDFTFAQEDEAIAIRLNSDFVAAQSLRENIIPRAVLYFTGEAIEDDDVSCFFLFSVFSFFFFCLRQRLVLKFRRKCDNFVGLRVIDAKVSNNCYAIGSLLNYILRNHPATRRKMIRFLSERAFFTFLPNPLCGFPNVSLLKPSLVTFFRIKLFLYILQSFQISVSKLVIVVKIIFILENRCRTLQ